MEDEKNKKNGMKQKNIVNKKHNVSEKECTLRRQESHEKEDQNYCWERRNNGKNGYRKKE